MEYVVLTSDYDYKRNWKFFDADSEEEAIEEVIGKHPSKLKNTDYSYISNKISDLGDLNTIILIDNNGKQISLMDTAKEYLKLYRVLYEDFAKIRTEAYEKDLLEKLLNKYKK